MSNICLCSKLFRRLFSISNEYHPSKIWLTTSSIIHNEEKQKTVVTSNPAVDMLKSKEGPSYQPRKIDKYLLVWMKKYPSVAEVPAFITNEQMDHVRNWARIKLNILTCILGAIGCAMMMYIGKQEAKQGKNLYTMHVDFHKDMDEKFRLEEERKKK